MLGTIPCEILSFNLPSLDSNLPVISLGKELPSVCFFEQYFLMFPSYSQDMLLAQPGALGYDEQLRASLGVCKV